MVGIPFTLNSKTGATANLPAKIAGRLKKSGKKIRAQENLGVTEPAQWKEHNRSNPSLRDGDYKLAEQIGNLQVKRKAGKKLHPLSRKVKLVKSLSL